MIPRTETETETEREVFPEFNFSLPTLKMEERNRGKTEGEVGKGREIVGVLNFPLSKITERSDQKDGFDE